MHFILMELIYVVIDYFENVTWIQPSRAYFGHKVLNEEDKRQSQFPSKAGGTRVKSVTYQAWPSFFSILPNSV